MAKLKGKNGYGIDLTADHAVVVRSVANKRYETVFNGPLEELQAADLHVAVSEIEKGRALAAGGMPVSGSITRYIKAPFPSVKKAVKVFPSLLDIQLPFPLEECVARFIHLQKSSDHVGALAVAARMDMVKTRLQQFTDAGWVLTALDHEGLALWTQSIDELPIEPDTFRMVIHIGYEDSTIIVGRGLVFESAHYCQIGLRDLRETDGSASMDMFVRRIHHVLQASRAPGSQAVQWVWTGPGAVEAGVLSQLETRIELDAETIRLKHQEPETMLARALSRRALEHDAFEMDFLTDSLSHPVVERLRQRSLRKAAGFYLILGVVIIALNAGWLGYLRIAEKKMTRQLMEAAQNLAPDSRIYPGQEILMVNRAREERMPLIEPFMKAFEVSLAVVLQDLLVVADELDMTFSKVSLRDDTVSIQGSSAAWSACEKLIPVVEKYGLSSSVPQREDAGADERVHFNISAGVADD